MATRNLHTKRSITSDQPYPKAAYPASEIDAAHHSHDQAEPIEDAKLSMIC